MPSAPLTALTPALGDGHTHEEHATRSRHEMNGRGVRSDLASHEVIVVHCSFGRSFEYHPGFLQRTYRLASDTLVFDLQFRLRCKGCNRRDGFRITIFDERMPGDNAKPRLERVVVAEE